MSEWKLKRGEQEWPIRDAVRLVEWAKAGRVAPTDYVFNPLLERWMLASEVPELAGVLKAPAATPAAPAAAGVGPQFLCTNCGYTGPSVRIVPGSNALGCVLLILFVIPGLIYAVWQQIKSGPGCPSCKQITTLIPIGSPQAQEILARRSRV